MNKIEKSFYKAPCEISWVGECPWTNTLCFGGEDGQLLIESPGPSVMGERETRSVQLATDAINEVAFAGDFIAVSSRNEVAVGKRGTRDENRLDRYHHDFIGGAHGVVASRAGNFLAPIADQGLLMLWIENSRIGVQIGSPRGIPFNFYKLIRLGNDLHGEAFAAAGRRDGLMALNFVDGRPSAPMVCHHFEGQDIVDVCPLNNPRYPHAVACVSRDRAIFFIRNVLEDQSPSSLNYAGLQGTAYTLLSTGGHLFLLTDQELIVMPSLAAQFLRGESLDQTREIRIIPVDASEAFLLRDRAVLLLEEEAIVSEIKIADMIGSLADDHATVEALRNGWIHQGKVVELASNVRPAQPVSTAAGSHVITKFEMVTSPAA